MEQRQRFQIDYQLNKKELREMSLRMTVSGFFQYKPFILIVVTWLAGAVFITLMEAAMGGSWMSLISNVAPILIIILLILLPTFLLDYQNLKRMFL